MGFGTWEAFGSGRVLVGFDAAQSEFDTLEEIGGAKTHTLTENELPIFTPTLNDPGHTHLTQRYPTADTSMSGTLADNTLPTKIATTGITVNAIGGGAAHPNLPPYIVVRFWKRIA
jgi:microcystin-dependent protein